MVREPREARDRGLARERTVLAWNRSGLAVVVCLAVLLRHLWPLHGASEYLAVALISAAAVVWAIALFVFTRSVAYRDSGARLGPKVFPIMTAGTLILALVGFVLAFVAAP